MGSESQFATSRTDSGATSTVKESPIGVSSHSSKLSSPGAAIGSALSRGNAKAPVTELPAHSGSEARQAYDLLLAAGDDPLRVAAAIARVLETAEKADAATATQLLEVAATFARTPVVADAVAAAENRLRERQRKQGVTEKALADNTAHGDDVAKIEAMPILRLGTRGPDVITLKSRLLDNGLQSVAYPFSAEDDTFDGHTHIAVRKFQWSRGLDVDGVVGRSCWLMLLGHSSGRALDLDDPSAAPKEIAATPGYDAALAAGQKRRKEWQDWGAEPPTNAKPGDYGDGWAMTSVGEIRVGGHTTWRYCNPGNILPGFKRHYTIGGVSAVNVAQPSGLAMFATMEDGWAALHALLRTALYGHKSVSTFTEVYLGIKMGRKSEFGDDPKAYRDSVGAQTGLSGSRILDDLNEDELQKLMRAINHVEGNQVGRVVLAGAKDAFYANAFGATP